MKIRLDLSGHCIETELKRLHQRLMSEYFKSKGADPETERKVEIIGRALETLDLPMLRSRFPDLDGGSGKSVFLSMDEGGKIRIHIGLEEVSSQ